MDAKILIKTEFKKEKFAELVRRTLAETRPAGQAFIKLYERLSNI